jgi:hypothetical protein
MDSDIGSKVVGIFMRTALVVSILTCGTQIYHTYSSDKTNKESLKRINAEATLIQQGRMERLYHISQSKGFDFVPSVELETNPYDRMEALYRLHCHRLS